MTRLGADATGETIAQLQALGVTFISRYVSDFLAKNLTLPEAQRLAAAGIDLITNWENDVNDWAGGYNQGVAFAKRALAQHTACGGPTGRSERWGIYFSVDEKVDPNNLTLHDYFRGANSVLSVAHTGVYGQTSVLRTLRSLALVGCGERGGTWRSMSTFGLPEGLGNPGEFDIEQTGWFNSSYDRDIANSTHFGQWRIGATVRLTTEATMQDALFAVADGPNGEKPGIWLRTSDGQYGHVASVDPDLLAIEQLVPGIQQKNISYAQHLSFLAMAAAASVTVTDAQAAAIGAAVAAGVKFPSSIQLNTVASGTLK